jgi:OmpA-OmpF porin, OOP family
MNKMRFAIPVALAIATLVSACATSSKPEPASPPPPPVAQNQKLSSDSLFAFGKSSLDNISDEGRAQLDAFAATLLGSRYEMVHVIGHSDRIGNAKANVDLSTRRAASVRDYLVQKGVPGNRITAVGRGSVEPVVECEERDRQALIACLAPNRRVEIRIVSGQ